MRSLTIKGVPDALYDRLRRSAVSNRRSLTKEIIVCLENATGGAIPTEEELVKRVEAVRERVGLYLTDEFIDDAINSGRP
jgi:hypothetical protein